MYQAATAIGRKGRILHIYRSLFAFIYNRNIVENAGVFVCYTRNLSSQKRKDVSLTAPAPGPMAAPGSGAPTGSMPPLRPFLSGKERTLFCS